MKYSWYERTFAFYITHRKQYPKYVSQKRACCQAFAGLTAPNDATICQKTSKIVTNIKQQKGCDWNKKLVSPYATRIWSNMRNQPRKNAQRKERCIEGCQLLGPQHFKNVDKIFCLRGCILHQLRHLLGNIELGLCDWEARDAHCFVELIRVFLFVWVVLVLDKKWMAS